MSITGFSNMTSLIIQYKMIAITKSVVSISRLNDPIMVKFSTFNQILTDKNKKA